MSVADVAQGEVSAAPAGRRGHGAGALTAGARALFAAVSGLVLSCGIGVVLWAVTPSSTGGPQQLLRAAVAAFAGGNGMTLLIGRASLTLPPLMIMVIAVGLLAGITGRGARVAADDRTGELTRTATAAVVYAAVVTTAGVVLGTPGTVAAEQWWRPFLLAFVVVGTTVFLRGQAWRQFVLDRTPSWIPVAARLGASGAAGMVAAGGVALVLALVGSFGNSATVQTLAAPGPAAGFGMALLGIAYLPNAVIAAAGYASGVGFHIGAGTYSPFGSAPVELPAVSALAAAPDGREASRVGMVLLLIPVVVALLLGRAAVRRLDLRRERLLAVGTGAVVAGVLVAVLAVVAGGGITGGQWATIGAPPLLFGIVTAALLGVLGAAIAGAARQSTAVEADAVSGVTDEPVTVEADAVGVADQPVGDAVADDSAGADGVADDVPTDGPAGSDRSAQGPAGDTRTAEDPAGDVQPVEEAGRSKVDADHPTADAGDGATAVDDQPDLAADERPEPEVDDQLVEPEQAGAADEEGAPASARAQQTDDAGTAVGSAQEPGTPVAVRSGASPGPVPQARREEDVLAESESPTDADMVEQLRPRSRPRQVG